MNKPIINLLDKWELPVDFDYDGKLQKAGRVVAESLEALIEQVGDDFEKEVKVNASWALDWLINQEGGLFAMFTERQEVDGKVTFDGPLKINCSFGNDSELTSEFSFDEMIYQEVDSRVTSAGDRADADRFLDKVRAVLDKHSKKEVKND